MKIKGVKVRPVIEATVTELYVTFPTPENFRMSGGKYDIDFTPARTEVPEASDEIKASASNAIKIEPAAQNADLKLGEEGK